MKHVIKSRAKTSADGSSCRTLYVFDTAENAAAEQRYINENERGLNCGHGFDCCGCWFVFSTKRRGKFLQVYTCANV